MNIAVISRNLFLSRMRRKLMVVVLMLVSGASFAQDPEFTQFYSNPLYLNPAFAGAARCPRIIMNYRNQWPALSGTFVTYSASYDQHVDGLQGGIGLLALNDKAGEGTLTKTFASAIYAYQVNVSRQFSIRLGIQATYYQFRVDWDKLNFGDMIDPKYGFVYKTLETRPGERLSYVDFSAGVLAYSSRVYGGFAAHHLTQPEESFLKAGDNKSPLPMKITGHIGALIPTSSDKGTPSYISPNVLFQQQQDFTQINFGLYGSKGPFVIGGWFRTGLHNGDAFILLAGIQQGIFKFGYSYDATVSRLIADTAGSHEVSFGLLFECKPKKRKFRTISCPSF